MSVWSEVKYFLLILFQRCESPRRPATDKVCCRDPNYSNGGEDNNHDNGFGNNEYMDFDGVGVVRYPYNPPKDER